MKEKCIMWRCYTAGGADKGKQGEDTGREWWQEEV